MTADRPPVSGEPRTEAGRRLLRKARTVDGWHTNFDAGDILDVEAEARATPPALDVLRDLDVAFQWIADNYPAALTAMPTPIYRGLTRARTHAARLAEQKGEDRDR